MQCPQLNIVRVRVKSKQLRQAVNGAVVDENTRDTRDDDDLPHSRKRQTTLPNSFAHRPRLPPLLSRRRMHLADVTAQKLEAAWQELQYVLEGEAEQGNENLLEDTYYTDAGSREDDLCHLVRREVSSEACVLHRDHCVTS